jgi:hypothetical protein
MHCGICGNTEVEVRPCYISKYDQDACQVTGDAYLCSACATSLQGDCIDSVFITWAGFPCDECSTPSAFDGVIDGMPAGIVCGDCTSSLDPNAQFGDSARGLWLCEPCFDKGHLGHQQKPLQPILDRLARL